MPVNLFGAYSRFELAASWGVQVIFLSTSRVYEGHLRGRPEDVVADVFDAKLPNHHF